ncbi:MAG: cytochrome c oxidase subunit [Chthoniobacter sp.]|jgi:caa(3)-type oxidase subunit IV|nr:cytochrome c oxidase subunit [Chthoniobacter sp.]
MSDTHATETLPGATPVHDHSHDAEHVAKHVKGYLVIGGVLIFLTFVTVWLSYVNFDELIGGHGWNFIIAMIVATFKVSLVGAIFMHLKGEKWTIWRFLLFTAFFVAGLFLLTLLNWGDPIFGTRHSTH